MNEGKLWYKRFTMTGDKTVLPAVSLAHCFKVPFELKDIFNRITKRYVSARNHSKRFYWDKKNKAWVTASKQSADEAEQELKKLVGDKTFAQSSSPIVPSSNIPSGADVIPITKRDWNAKEKYFSFYASDKDIRHPGKVVWLKSPSGQAVKFNFTHADMDGTNEDTYGWNYVSDDKKFKLLIIND